MKPPNEFLDFAVKLCGPQAVTLIEIWEEERLRIGQIEHGRISNYTNAYCRCAECRAVNAATRRARYQADAELGAARVRASRAKKKGTAPGRHGTPTAYNVHGCRCDLCRQARNDYQRAYRARRKAVTA